MKLSLTTIPVILAATAAAIPTATLDKRAATTICGQWDSVQTGTYTVYQDLWGESAATSGSQCTTVTSDSSDGTLVWSTSWTWAGGSSSVKSFANTVVKQTTGIQLSKITTIPTTWHWSYTGTSIVADVAYDAFTSATATGSSAYEIMIWLGALGGAGPISSTGSTIATPTINGVTWKLYKGPNGSMTVFSFVAPSSQTAFTGDIKLFLQYLITSQGLPSSQYLTSIGAGTEPFTGSNAVFKTSAYKIVINQ